MPDFLNDTTGPQGEKFLVDSTGPQGEKFLTTNTGCANCCPSACTRIRRYDACYVPPNLQPCVGPLTHIWACEPAICTEAIHYGNRCFIRTSVVIPMDQKPPNDVLVDNPPECSPGCTDPDPQKPCTVCNLYYRAVACNGSRDCGVYFVPVATLAGGCGMLINDGPNGAGCCYFVGVGPTYTEDQIPAGAFIYPGVLVYDRDCCDCVGGCAGHIFTPDFDCTSGMPIVRGPCCCTSSYTLTTDFDYSVTLHFGSGYRTEYRVPHQHVVKDFPNSLPFTPFTMIQTDYDPDGNVVNTTQVFGTLPNWACGIAPTFQFGDPLDEQFLCPSENTDPNLSCSAIRTSTCTGMLASGSWIRTDPNIPGYRVEYSVTIRQSIVQRGPCAGGCGGGGIPGNPGTSLPINPLPPEQWPLLIKTAAFFKSSKDKGVGDTVARTIGPVGGDAFKAWAKAVGFECGCADRQAALNRTYPYPPTGL